MPPKSSTANMSSDDSRQSASVLGELKDTVQSQAKDIQRLKSEIKKLGGDPNPKATAAATSVSHGGHGGGAEPSAEEVAHYLENPFYQVSLQRV